MNNNNQQNQAGTNPFQQNNNANNNNNSRFSSGSRFGANNNNRNTNSRFSSRFGANNNNNANNNTGLNRFGQQTIFWTVAPLNDVALRISLDGLGDPFHRLLGTTLNVEYGQPEKVVEALQEDEELRNKLTEVLDEAWESYHFEGAALLFPWDEDVRKAYSQPIHLNEDFLNNNQNVQNNQNNNNVNNQNQNVQNNNQQNNNLPDWLEALTVDEKQNVQCLRAIDLAFVLNILARARANVVVANTPLALEPGFLTQTVICDDPRIIAIARATGCIDEVW